MKIVNQIRKILENEIKRTPNGFYDSFSYTQTGNNLTHPLTIGIICKIIWKLKGIEQVGVDVRLNKNGIKFYPDIVGYDKNGDIKIIVDYESPNSSDMRIPIKDVRAYINWCDESKIEPPYIIVTTLPNFKPSG